MRDEDEGFPTESDSGVGNVFDQLADEQPVPGGHQRVWAFEGLDDKQQDIGTSLAEWWMETTEKDIQAVVPKAAQYGGADLTVMGKAMESMIPKDVEMSAEARRRLGLEMAVGFYALGKVARLFGAFEQGRMPSDDTWFDLEIYARMGRKVRETGEWVTL